MGQRDLKTKEFSKGKPSENSLFTFNGSGEIGKSHLIKTICQSVSEVLQYVGGSPDKQLVLILEPTGFARITVHIRQFECCLIRNFIISNTF